MSWGAASVGAVALAGWTCALWLLLVLRARLALAADAEHELRGALAALGLATERMKRSGASRAYASLLDVQLARAAAGLADLERARRPVRRRASGPRGREASGAPGRSDRLRPRFDRHAADSARLAQVVTNLVANAAEHGAGPVEIRWRPTDSGGRLEIRNLNRPPALDALSAGRATGGERGRGLGIAGRAARDMGASLRWESGEGITAATLDLPRAATAGARAEAPPLAGRNVQDAGRTVQDAARPVQPGGGAGLAA